MPTVLKEVVLFANLAAGAEQSARARQSTVKLLLIREFYFEAQYSFQATDPRASRGFLF